eukprot:4944767-Pyramimonas_sp.AAC.1
MPDQSDTVSAGIFSCRTIIRRRSRRPKQPATTSPSELTAYNRRSKRRQTTRRLCSPHPLTKPRQKIIHETPKSAPRSPDPRSRRSKRGDQTSAAS